MKKTKLAVMCFFLLQVFAIYLVTSGFFLVTEQVPVSHEKNPFDGSEVWFKPKAKVILFIIDALRFDFFYYNETLVGHEEYPYQNKFVKLHNIVKANPENFIQFKTYADPPTVTVHRVQSMLTGNLPPFVEITENFGSSAISEDNIIKKLTNEKRIVHLVGDYIWTDLFPNDFKECYPVQSFDIHDFDSVDNIIKEKIFPLIEKNDFDLLIAHGIGSDHIGHTYGIFHEKIGEKLSEMDELAVKIIEAMDDNTILFIMGDHGMSDEGDHGGGSKGETETVIGAYYKGGFRKYKEPELNSIMKTFQEDSPSMLIQMDLAPTLAMLLGLPIPYSNTGQMINDFYVNEINEKENNESPKEFIYKLVRDNYINMLQTAEYMAVVQEKFNKFPIEAFLAIDQRYKEIKKETGEFLIQFEKGLSKEEKTLNGIRIIRQMQELSQDVYDLIKRSNSYDFFLMAVGIALSIGCFFLLFVTLQFIHIQMKSEKALHSFKQDILISEIITSAWNEIRSSKISQLVALGLVTIAYLMKLGKLKMFSLLVLLVVFHVLFILGRFCFLQTKQILQGQERDQPKSVHFTLRTLVFLFESPLDTAVSIIAIIFQLFVRLSVAATRLERDYLETMLRYICLFGIGTVWTPSKKSISLKDKIQHTGLLVLFAIIISILPYFDPSFYSEVSKDKGWSEPFFYSPFIKILLPLMIFVFLMFQQINLSLKNLKFCKVVQALQITSLLFISLYYVLAAFQPNFQKNYFIQILIPRIAYITLLSAFILVRYKTSESRNQRNGNSEYISRNETNFLYSNGEICFIQILLLLSGPNSVMAFVLLFLSFKILNHYFSQTYPSALFYTFAIGLLSFFGYFCTGHSNQVTNIQVSQGFVGFDQFYLYLSGLLVLLNTMSSFILGMISITSFLRVSFDQTKDANSNQEKGKLRFEFISLKNWTIYSMFFIAGYVAISINSFINHDSLLLVYDFAPKYLIDTAIYFFVIVCVLFIKVLRRT